MSFLYDQVRTEPCRKEEKKAGERGGGNTFLEKEEKRVAPSFCSLSQGIPGIPCEGRENLRKGIPL